MHELALSENIVAGVVDRIGDRRVTRVVLEIGRLSGVVPDALRFCFDLCTEGTLLAGAALEIVDIPARGRCRACDAEILVGSFLDLCPCGSDDLELHGGRELRVKKVEVM